MIMDYASDWSVNTACWSAPVRASDWRKSSETLCAQDSRIHRRCPNVILLILFRLELLTDRNTADRYTHNDLDCFTSQMAEYGDEDSDIASTVRQPLSPIWA